MTNFAALTASAALAPIVVVGLIGTGATSEPQLDADPAGATEDRSASAVLEAIIEQNLVHLNDGVEGQFSADIGGYGDLDGDGLEDGVVLFTYESQRLKHARFVAAYLYDGESYDLAASKPLASSDDNIHSAGIDSIEDGIISLRLSVLEPGDASCCPSGQRLQRLALRDGQLVEVTPPASPMPGQAEEALATEPPQEPMTLAVPRAGDSAESEERAKSAGDERAAETDIESPERASQAAPLQPGRSPQAPADQAMSGAARPQGAGETSSVDDPPATEIRVFIHHVARHQGGTPPWPGSLPIICDAAASSWRTSGRSISASASPAYGTSSRATVPPAGSWSKRSAGFSKRRRRWHGRATSPITCRNPAQATSRSGYQPGNGWQRARNVKRRAPEPCLVAAGRAQRGGIDGAPATAVPTARTGRS
jgi:hypothetical protein